MRFIYVSIIQWLLKANMDAVQKPSQAPAAFEPFDKNLPDASLRLNLKPSTAVPR